MGKTPVNTALGEVRGKIDDWVFRKVEGEVVVARRPRPRVDRPSDGQQHVRERFRRAILYARAVFADPPRKQVYLELAARRGVSAARLFGFVVQDYARPPQITEINVSNYQRRIADVILIYARDDGEVSSVTVALKTTDGAVIETGPATITDAAWKYSATTAVPTGTPVWVEATATDHANNRTLKIAVVT